MSYRGPSTPPFLREQDGSQGPFRGRGRGSSGQGFGRGRGRGRGGGTDFPPGPADPPPQAAPSGVYQHPHASRARGRGGWGRGGQNAWSQSNSSRGSGASTPRGYPPRNNFSHHGQAPAPRGGGLGFHNASNRPAPNFPRSGPEPPRTTRGTSDPRLWIPVKFVKATALTDIAVEKIPKEKLQDQKSESQPVPPLAPEIRPKPAPPSPSDRLLEIEEITPASVEQWEADFPGIFQKDCSISAFRPNSSSPSKPAQAADSSKDDRTPTPTGESPEKVSGPCATGPETSQIAAPDSAIQAPKSTAAPEPAPLTGSGPAGSGALFFIDAEGDPNNNASKSSIQVSKLDGPITKETDDEEERIVFQPDPSATSETQTNDSHLFRTVTDEVLVQSLVSDTSVASDPDATQSKSLAPKPSKQAIKARQRVARKERRQSAHGGQPDLTAHRPDDVESGSDIDWGDDNAREPTMPSGSGEKVPQALSNKAQSRARKDKEEMELCEDYIKGAMIAEAASGDGPDEPSATTILNDSFTKTFMDGMAAQQKHTTIEELDQNAQNEIDDNILDQQRPRWGSPESDSVEEEIEYIDPYISDTENESTGSGSSDESLDDEDDLETETSLEKSLELSTDSSDASEPEEEPLELANEVKDGKGKTNQKEGENNKDPDSELVEFVDDLQKKWKLDRARKAERKKARAEARRESAPKTKKQRKKADQQESNSPPPDVPRLNEIIRDFICYHPDDQVLTLPPVDKASRAAVHQIANLYKMKSQSRGSGKRRYPVLTRTHRTTHILASRQPLFQILNRFTDPGRSEAQRSMGLVPRNREGAIVGQGVAHIGEENVGFKLLTKMGWSIGETIGDPKNVSALQKPLMAVMKNTKGGLGLSSHQFGNY